MSVQRVHSLTLFTLFITLAAAQSTFPYELETHKEITKNAYAVSAIPQQVFSDLGIPTNQKFQVRRFLGLFFEARTALEWLVEGSVREDVSGSLQHRVGSSSFPATR